MPNDRNVFHPTAYADGVRAGHADRLLGVRSDYAWQGYGLDQTYTYAWHYSRGYRDGYERRTLPSQLAAPKCAQCAAHPLAPVHCPHGGTKNA